MFSCLLCKDEEGKIITPMELGSWAGFQNECIKTTSGGERRSSEMSNLREGFLRDGQFGKGSGEETDFNQQ